MDREAAYPAAEIVSPRIHDYFSRKHAKFTATTRLAALPDAATIQAIIDAAFWTSLRREEGFSPKISLAFLSPEEAGSALLFERPLPLNSRFLTKVAPAVERPGIHLGVSHAQQRGSNDAPTPLRSPDLAVWGAARTLPGLCFVVEVSAPGLIVMKHHSKDGNGKFINVAVLEGDQIKILAPRSAIIPDSPALLNAILSPESPSASGAHSVNVLLQLAISMRAHGRGGSLLIVPTLTDSWRESIVTPIPYAVSPPFSDLSELSRSAAETRQLTRMIEAVAGLTAVDGAVVLTDRYDVLGFGAKITRRRGHGLIDQVLVSEPIEGGDAILVNPDKLGGTRHLSAAQFVQDQHDCAALVASQDGRFTVFEWSPADAMVRAHRIETLLL